MKKMLVILFVLAVSASIFAAGGGQGASTGAGEIRVLLANHAYTDQVLRSAIPEFERETGIRVLWETLQESQLTQRLTTEFATRSSTVDVFMTRPLQEALLFNKNGWYAPLTAYDFSDFSPSTVELGMHNGRPHIVPLITEWQVLYYRRDLFQAAGLSVPTTLAELENAARVLTAGGVAGIGIRGAGPAAVTQLSSYIYNFGGTYLENGVAVFDRPEAMEAIRYYGRILGNYGPQGVTALSWEGLIPVFQAGRIAMFTDASSLAGNLIDQDRTQIPIEHFGVAKLPAGPRGDAPYNVVAWGMAIASTTRDMNTAMRFLNWATSRDLYARAMRANVITPRNSVWNDRSVTGAMHPGLVETFNQAAASSNPLDRPFMTSVVQARELIGEVIIESINTSGQSPRLQALATQKANEVNDLLRADGEYGGR